jgi:hypothetical protein
MGVLFCDRRIAGHSRCTYQGIAMSVTSALGAVAAGFLTALAQLVPLLTG